jgi:HAD superfamily hydrolase (TIGR01458 family)
VRGVCIDLDGVLYVEETVVPGSVAAVARLAASGRAIRYVTNTTSRGRRALVAKLSALGFPAEASQVFAAPAAAAAALRARGVRRIAPLLAPAALEEFDGFELTDDAPEAVVVGDMGDLWTPAILNRALRHLLAGARLVALCRTSTWRSAAGIVMDAGPYVAALECAARVEAEVAGKPSPAFFRAAVASMGIAPQEALMIGDDPESDVAAAEAAGLRAALVLSGKVRAEDVAGYATPPKRVFPSIVEVVAALE